MERRLVERLAEEVVRHLTVQLQTRTEEARTG
jgi:hypothetical protein